MPDERPKNFIERLPEIIDREESEISHLDPEMIEILYPDRADQSFHVTLVFGPPPEAESDSNDTSGSYEIAVSVAQKALRYRCDGSGRSMRHRATFGLDEVTQQHDIFVLVRDYPSCQVLLRGKRVPYGRELWLPLLWFFKKDPLTT